MDFTTSFFHLNILFRKRNTIWLVWYAILEAAISVTTYRWVGCKALMEKLPKLVIFLYFKKIIALVMVVVFFCHYALGCRRKSWLEFLDLGTWTSNFSLKFSGSKAPIIFHIFSTISLTITVLVFVDWRNFDDSIVTRTQLSRVQNDDAYLLFYKQRGTATRDLLKKHYDIG